MILSIIKLVRHLTKGTERVGYQFMKIH